MRAQTSSVEKDSSAWVSERSAAACNVSNSSKEAKKGPTASKMWRAMARRREGERSKQTDRQTRQTDRQTDRQVDRYL